MSTASRINEIKRKPKKQQTEADKRFLRAFGAGVSASKKKARKHR